MNKTVGLLLVGYSLLLGVLSYLVHRLVPAGTQPTLIAGLAGAALSLVWGLRGAAGSGGKALPLLTLIPVSFTLLPQTFMSWSGASGGQTGLGAAALMTLLLVLSLAMLMRIAWSGVLFDVPRDGSRREENAKAGGRR